ncbi:phage tail protein [Undibacterium flavidum]|uniref:Phage tail protein n=1 Tax=Undibacterium flavidum TaxID=2762297 RepID=A0ABR6YAM6_9BURK|nr:tail fiber protein [Undibacterium flavidum]MBC3873665.1 phage tail protein [Undibacterium flavidum]
MSQPYVGEIRLFGGNFAPAGWMFCEGQLLPISENETLFNLIGTTYGGDGESTFALPDMRGRLPIHFGSGYVLAETGGAEEITLTVNQIPNHTHTLTGKAATGAAPQGNATHQTPVANMPASGSIKAFATASPSPTVLMNAAAIDSTGGSQPHTNMMPYVCISFIISLFGVFPSQN